MFRVQFELDIFGRSIHFAWSGCSYKFGQNFRNSYYTFVSNTLTELLLNLNITSTHATFDGQTEKFVTNNTFSAHLSIFSVDFVLDHTVITVPNSGL